MTHRILVVDDEPDITALVAYHLARAGYRVSTASNGQVNGLEVRLFKLDAGDFIPDDQAFTVALYGAI